MTHARPKKIGLVALALTAVLAVAGCSDHDMGTTAPGASAPAANPTGSSSASAEFNDADVMFVQMMLPHHEQAVAMSDTLLAKSGVAPDVAALAEQIKAAQQPEIDTMKGFLAAWGQQETGGGMGGMDHGGDDGMATDAQLKELDQADGAAGQQAYLQLMTAHHEGAVTMAQTEVRDGKNAGAVDLAKTIITTQQQEIGVMKDLLARL
ncbi:DUF305 domain-containing protein [Microlunatus spumicola]|uniref:DUF305 domain-containing protein n=1 Tax=Microlunatus spumicola TaxID=81499 RepID=A0ABP6WHL3_9ACTN